MESKPTISPEEFARCDLRVGTVLSAEPLEGARRPALLLMIDFGPLGTLKSTAQVVRDYRPEDLPGRQVIAVVNFPPKQVGHHLSRCLVLGAVPEGHVHLLSPDREVPPGTAIA